MTRPSLLKPQFVIHDKPGAGRKLGTEVLQIPAIEQQMVAQGRDPVGGAPAQFAQFVQREYEKWRVIVRESGARAE